MRKTRHPHARDDSEKNSKRVFNENRNRITLIFRIQTHLDLLLICYIRESPGVHLNFVWVVGAVKVPVSL